MNFTADEMLYQIILGWWLEKYAFNYMLGKIFNVKQHQLPSHGIASAPITTRYYFGIPRSASYRSHTLDVKEDFLLVQQANFDNHLQKQFVLKSGLIGSYLEGSIFKQAFLAGRENGVSTVSLIQAANVQGIPIYTIDHNNVAQVLPNLQISEDLQSEIKNAINAGKIVTIPKQDVTYFGYTGIGYVIEDPMTGAAAYQIDGGLSGGFSSDEAVVGSVIPKAAATSGSFIIRSMAAATFESPQVTALLLRSFGFAPNPAGLAFAGIALIIVVAYVIMSAVMQQEDFRQEVIRWAASSALAQGFSEGNCTAGAAPKHLIIMYAVNGWMPCLYTCPRSAPGQIFTRFLPTELACPSPVPCAHGFYGGPPAGYVPRKVGDPIPPGSEICRGLI